MTDSRAVKVLMESDQGSKFLFCRVSDPNKGYPPLLETL